MRAPRQLVDKRHVQYRTESNRDHVINLIKRAHAMDHDEDRVQRLKDCKCRSCYYRGLGIAGQAFTDRECGICAEVQSYHTTATDVLCMKCAKEHSLCKECGADLELRPQRRKFDFTPVPIPALECPGCTALNRNHRWDCPARTRSESSVVMLPKRDTEKEMSS